ncbi:MAG: hypothetical protein CMO01_18675 [Thalassobius sp.]|nr:hypothetical protein [Thalassovita sp.]
MLVEKLSAQSQDTLAYPYKITGHIYDELGNAMPGVSIVSKGDGNHQLSDFEGKYHATIYNSNTIIYFMVFNYSNVEYIPDGRTEIDITLISEKKSWLKKKWLGLKHMFH